MQCIALLLAVITPGCFAAGGTSPATFLPGPKGLAARVRIPAHLPEGTFYIFCSGVATRFGWLKSTSCFHSNAGNQAAAEAVVRPVLNASRRARLSPARRDGNIKTVWFDYTVAVDKHGDASHVKVFANHMLSFAKFGMHYTGPQRLLEYASSRNPTCSLRLLVMVRGEIDTNGVGHDFSIAMSHRHETVACLRSMIRTLKMNTYIPATANGQPVAAPYEEVFYTRTSSAQFGHQRW